MLGSIPNGTDPMAERSFYFLIQPSSNSPSHTAISPQIFMVSTTASSCSLRSFEAWKQSFKGKLGARRTSRAFTAGFPIYHLHSSPSATIFAPILKLFPSTSDSYPRLIGRGPITLPVVTARSSCFEYLRLVNARLHGCPFATPANGCETRNSNVDRHRRNRREMPRTASDSHELLRMAYCSLADVLDDESKSRR